ncbi:MAG TPA: substrate-binding domain-containing protein [Anaerolineales bacterium]|nr:substrate-binding domain-containing protein [Anaerolineales bacterium]
MKKIQMITGLLVIIALMLAACQPAAPAETQAPEPEQTQESTKPPEPTPVPPTDEPVMTEEPVVTEEPLGEPLKIGVMSDLTGALALFGNEMWNGLQIGFEYATDGTMVAGNRPIELIIRDDTSDVEAGTAAARELIEAEGVEILIGNSSSGVAAQVQQIANENEVVYFAAPAASHDIVGANWNPYTFRVCRDSAQDAPTIAKWAIENVGTSYLILAEDYAFGQATAAGFNAVFSALGATFLTEQPIFAPSDTTDFTPYIQQILAAEPDGLILIWASNTSAQILFDQLTTQGVTGNIPFITGFSSNDLTKLLDAGTIGSVGLIVYHYTMPDTAANDYLTEQYIAQFAGPPDLFSECGFATAQAVVAALNATSGDTDGATLIPALEGLTFDGPKGSYTIRAGDHQALAPMYVVRLVNVDDPDDKFFEKVSEVSAEESAPPCDASNCP